MIAVAKDWNPKQQKLKELLADKVNWQEAVQLCIEMHSELHASAVNATGHATYLDELTGGLTNEGYAYRPEGSSATIAWNL